MIYKIQRFFRKLILFFMGKKYKTTRLWTTYKTYPVRLFDVSQYNDNPETPYVPTLEKIVAAGFMGIGVRVGYGIVEDNDFKHYWKEAKGKLERLPYWYFDYYSHKNKGMTIESWAKIQASTCWNLLKEDPGEIPLAIDCEASTYGGAITIFNSSEYARGIKAFMQEYIRLSGGKMIMYFSPGLMWVFGDWFKDFGLWMAWYNRNLTLTDLKDKLTINKWRAGAYIWQYASDGDINDDGIADGVVLGFESKFLDLNVFLGTVMEWSEFIGNSGSIPVTPPTEDPIPPVIPTTNERTIKVMVVDCLSGLNIRNTPIIPSSVIGWVANKATVDILEITTVGSNIWARVGIKQYCAIKYNGVTYLK